MKSRAAVTHKTGQGLSVRIQIASLLALAAAAGVAQEGYPLDGTWRGDWGSTVTDRTPVVLVMKWDGDSIDGVINPGPDSVPFTAASLDPSNWTVHLEADGRDDAGAPVKIIVDGQLDNIGSYNRTIEGTWREGSVQGEFKIIRE